MAAESPSPSEPPAFNPELDHFARLGLRLGFEQDRAEVDANYRTRSVGVHPDRFVAADSSSKRRAMEHASALNEAYRVVRDPVLRAEYLVRLGGIDLDSSDPNTGAPKPSQAFLLDMIERRETLEDAADAGPSKLGRLRRRVDVELEDALEDAVAALTSGNNRAAAEAMVLHRYLRRYAEEIEAAQENS